MSSKKTEKQHFEDALDKTGFGLYSYLHTCLTGLIVISYICVTYGSTIIVPASACDLDTTTGQQGAMVAAPTVGNVIGTLLWGYLGDTRGRRRMLLLSLCCASVLNALASISVNWIMLMMIQFLVVFFASGQFGLSVTLVSELVPKAKRNLVVLLVSSIFMLSQGVISTLAIPILPLTFSNYLSALDIHWTSWRLLLLVYSLPSLISAVWLFFMQESPKFVLSRGDEEASLEILRTIHRVNKGRGEELEVQGLLLEATDSTGGTSVKEQVLPLFKAPLLKPTLIMTSLFVLVHAPSSFMVWLPTVSNQFIQTMQTGEGSDLTLCGIISTSLNAPDNPDVVPCSIDVTALLLVLAVCLLTSFTNALISLVVGYGGRRNTAIVCTLVFGVSGILVNLVPNAIGSAVCFAGFLLGIIVIGMYTAICVAVFPTHVKAMAVAVVMTGGRLSGFAFIQLVNFLLVNNCEVGFYLFASLYATSALFLTLLPDDRLLLKPVHDKDDNTSL